MIATSNGAGWSHLGGLIFGICLPIVVVITLGWIIDRKFRIDLVSLVKLNLYVFVPSFIFVRVVSSEVTSKAGGGAVAFTLLMIGAMALASMVVTRLTRADEKTGKSLQLSTMFYNCGNYGVPLMTLAFPERGPALQAFVLMTMNVTTFTVGLWLANSHGADRSQPAWKTLLPVLRQPTIYGVVSALTVRALHLEPAVQSVTFLWKPLSYLADGLVGIALLTLGVQLSQTKPPPVRGPLAWALGIRLIGGPLIAAGLAYLMGFRGETAAIFILGTAAPTAVNVSLLAHEFDADYQFAAAAVFYSTIMSAVTVTIVLLVLVSR